MSSLSEQFQPKIYKDFPKPVQQTQVAYKTTSSGYNYNAVTTDPTSKSRRGLQFQVDPPSFNTVIRRDMMVDVELVHKVQVRVENKDLPINEPLYQSNALALRDHPLNRLWDSPRLTLNTNHQVSVDLSQQFQMQNLTMYREEDQTKYLTPSNPDIGFQNYNSAVDSNSTPLAGYTNMTLSQLVPDGAFAPIGFCKPNGELLQSGDTYDGTGDGGNAITVEGDSTGANGNALNITANVGGANVPVGRVINLYPRYRLQAVPWISPLLYDGSDGSEHEGIWGIKQLRMNLNTVDTPKIMRNCTATLSGSTTQLEVTGEDYAQEPFPEASLRYLTMEPPYDLPEGLPNMNVLPFYRFDSYPKIVGKFGNDNKLKARSDQLQIGTIPDMMMVGVRPQRENLDARSADFHYVPESVSIRIGNEFNLLRTYNQADLFGITRKYIPIDYDTFRGLGRSDKGGEISLTSAPLVFRLGEDIPLSPGLASGVSTHTNISIEMNVFDQTGSATEDVELVVLFLDSSFLFNKEGVSESFSGFLTRDDVYNATVWNEQEDIDPKLGGKKKKSLMGSLGNAVSKVGNKVANKAIDKATDKAIGKLTGLK